MWSHHSLDLIQAVKNAANYWNYNKKGYQGKTFGKLCIVLISLLVESFTLMVRLHNSLNIKSGFIIQLLWQPVRSRGLITIFSICSIQYTIRFCAWDFFRTIVDEGAEFLQQALCETLPLQDISKSFNNSVNVPHLSMLTYLFKVHEQ